MKMNENSDGYPCGIFRASFKEKKDSEWANGYYINRQDGTPILLTVDGVTVGSVWDLSINWAERV